MIGTVITTAAAAIEPIGCWNCDAPVKKAIAAGTVRALVVDVSEIAKTKSFQAKMNTRMAVVKMPGLGVPGSDASVDVQGTRTAWGLTVMKSAPNRENAIKFLQLLFAPGDIGQTTLQKVGPAPISPPLVSSDDYEQLPPELRDLVTSGDPLGA